MQRKHHPTKAFTLLLGFALILSACGDTEAKNGDGEELDFVSLEEAGLEPFKLYEPPAGSSARLAYEAGLVSYFEKITRVVHHTEGQRAGEEGFTFDKEEGPQCIRGDVYSVSTRDLGSKDLVLFLQGGGACWSDFCLAVTKAPTNMPRPLILNPELEANPVASMNVVYFPYCDGSLFAGDHIVPEDDPEKVEKGHTERIYRGLANLTAGLVVSKARFPNPERIVLAGSSAGGYGTILASFLVRYVYPDAELIIVNDAGVGIGKDGQPGFIDQLLGEFGAARFVPDDCEECFVNGHITPLIDYFLSRDTNSRAAAVTSWYDFIIADIFMGVDPEDFADALDIETTKLHEKFPDRYRRYIYWGSKGTGHTALLGDASGLIGAGSAISVEMPKGVNFAGLITNLELLRFHQLSVEGVTLAEWIGAMIDNDLTAWKDLLVSRDGPEEPEEGEDPGDGTGEDDANEEEGEG